MKVPSGPLRPGGVLAVCAHPDDESFGLGAVLAALDGAGARLGVLSFTRGEASTLGTEDCGGDLAKLRAGELTAAAGVLGIALTELLDYPDGALADVALEELAAHVHRQAVRTGADTILVFDEGGITGHPDHDRATSAAMVAAGRDDLDVIAWAIPDHVAATLNAEFGTGFVGRPPQDLDLTITADRRLQREAIACHGSQSTANPVLWRRLELLGDVEHLRYLRRRAGGAGSTACHR